MLKTIFTICVLLFAMSCSDNSKYPEEVKELAIDGIAYTGLNEEHPSFKFKIKSGNGDYRIIYPKIIEIIDEDSNHSSIAYSPDQVSVSVTPDKDVLVELKNTTLAGLDKSFACYILLTDKSSQKRLILVTETRNVIIEDFDRLEKAMIAKTDYWQD